MNNQIHEMISGNRFNPLPDRDYIKPTRILIVKNPDTYSRKEHPSYDCFHALNNL